MRTNYQSFAMVLVAACALSRTSAQTGLTMSTTGNSSLLFRGNSFGLNVTDASIEFTLNNLGNAIGQDKCTIWGVGARAGNSSGVGNIFSNGNFIPGANAEGYFGRSYSTGQLPHAFKPLMKRMDDLESEFKSTYYIEMRATAIRTIVQPELVDQLGAILDALDPDKNPTHIALKKIMAVTTTDAKFAPLLQAQKNFLEAKHHELVEGFDERYEDMERLLESGQGRLQDSGPYTQFSWFVFGGINGNAFKLIQAFDTVNVGNSFQKQEFRGGKFGLGVNFQCGILGFGLTYQYTHSNNIADLTKTDYTIRTTRTTGVNALVSEEKVTAYSGRYGETEYNQLSFDGMINLSLDDETLSQVLLSPYARFNVASRDTTLLKNTWNLGLGGYFLDGTGKFIGGLYLELPDVGNAVEKSKPLAEQNLRPAEMRITFGIVAKITLGSVLRLY